MAAVQHAFSAIRDAVGQFFFLSAIQASIASGVLREIPVPGIVALGLQVIRRSTKKWRRNTNPTSASGALFEGL